METFKYILVYKTLYCRYIYNILLYGIIRGDLMKIKLFFMIMLITVMSAFVLAEECTTKEELLIDNLNVRYDFYYYAAEALNVRMGAVISAIDGDTTELESIRADFVANYDTAKAAADNGAIIGFYEAVEQGADYVMAFKGEANSSITNYSAVKYALNATMGENKAYLDGLKQTALDNQLSHRLNVYQQSLCRANQFIDDNNITDAEFLALVSAFQQKYNEGQHTLTEAYNTCKLQALIQCDEEIAEEALEIIHDFKNDTEEIVQAAIVLMEAKKEEVMAAIADGVMVAHEGFINLAVDLIATAETAGWDVTEEKALLADANATYNEAVTTYEGGDIDGAKVLLEESKESLIAIKVSLQAKKQQYAANATTGSDGSNTGSQGGWLKNKI